MRLVRPLRGAVTVLTALAAEAGERVRALLGV